MDDPEGELRRLPGVTAPATFATSVMARVSRLAEGRAPVASPARAPVALSRVGRARWWRGWASAVAGLAIACVSWTMGGPQPSWWRDLTWSQPAASWTNTPLAVLFGLGFGVLLYVAGLFAPLREQQ